MEQNTKGGKKTWLIVLIVIILVLIAYFLFPKSEVISPEKSTGIIGDRVEITRVVSEKQDLQTAGISIQFNQESSDYFYLNIAVDFNQDGKYENYQTTAGTQAEWVAMNMLAVVDPEESATYSFLLTDNEILNRGNFSVVVTLSKEKLETWFGEVLSENENKTATVAQINTEELDPYWDITAPENYGAGLVYAAEITHSASHSDLPDINQGKNECAPVATANSLLWLAKKYKFEDKMPADQDALIAELKSDLNWQAVSGVSPSNFKSGKDAFMKRHQISVVTKKLGGNFEEDLFEQIYQELQQGCDVEAVIQFQDNSGKSTGAHMVTVQGTYRYSDAAQTDSNLSIHDPLSRGPFKADLYRINPRDKNRLNNYRYGQNARVKEAWSECYVPPEPVVESATPPSAEPEDALPQPEDETGEGYGQAQPPAVSGTSYNFEHKIGSSPCPQTIGTISLTGQGSWSISGSLPTWLQVTQSSGTIPGSLSLQFNCVLAEYITQEVTGSFNLQLTDANNNVTAQAIEVGGYIEQ